MRLEDKIAIVVGSDQSPGEGMGNRRGTACASPRKAPRFWPSTRTSPLPRKRSRWRDYDAFFAKC
jgi:hypothetical protein